MKVINILKENILSFDIKRFFQTFKIEILKHKNSYMIGILISAILYTLINTLSLTFNIKGLTSPDGFFNLSLLIGIIITGGMFKEFYSKDRATSFLMTPSSAVEKWCTKVLISSVGYYLVISAIFSVLLLLFALMNQSVSGISFRFLIKNALNYLFFHSLFFFGAIFFRKQAIVKSLLVLLFVMLFFGIIAGITKLMAITTGAQLYEFLNDVFDHTFKNRYIKYSFSTGMILLFYGASFVRLTKKEVY